MCSLAEFCTQSFAPMHGHSYFCTRSVCWNANLGRVLYLICLLKYIVIVLYLICLFPSMPWIKHQSCISLELIALSWWTIWWCGWLYWCKGGGAAIYQVDQVGEADLIHLDHGGSRSWSFRSSARSRSTSQVASSMRGYLHQVGGWSSRMFVNIRRLARLVQSIVDQM